MLQENKTVGLLKIRRIAAKVMIATEFSVKSHGCIFYQNVWFKLNGSGVGVQSSVNCTEMRCLATGC